MILRFFRPDRRRQAIEALYARVAEASRAPALYLCHGVPDTGDGRFESLTLHMVLVLRRLRRLPPPADEVAQDLVDLTFSHLDAALRQMGVGDVTVPKRMKALARAFYGRAASYDAALDSGEAAPLAAALARNLIGRQGAAAVSAEARTAGAAEARTAGAAEALADYARNADEALARLDLDAILTTTRLFPSEVGRAGRVP